MNVEQAIWVIIGELPSGLVQQLRKVKFLVRDVPDPDDIARGCVADQRGYFWGYPVEPVEGTELPDEEPPRGEIVLFRKNIKPLTMENTARVLIHEIGHVFGLDESELLYELGLSA